MPEVTVSSLTYDNSVRKSWSARIMEQAGERLVLEGIFENEIEHPDLGRIEAGTVSIEYYWLARWYSIFRFLTPDGTLRNYYCNVNMPPVFEGSKLSYVDLDLDLVVWPGGNYSVLDREEFEENANVFSYPASVKENALRALEELIGMVQSNNLPA